MSVGFPRTDQVGGVRFAPGLGPPTGGDGDHEMTKEQKIIRAKAGL